MTAQIPIVADSLRAVAPALPRSDTRLRRFGTSRRASDSVRLAVSLLLIAVIIAPAAHAIPLPDPSQLPLAQLADSTSSKSCSSTCAISFSASSHVIYGIAPAYVGTVKLTLDFGSTTLSTHTCAVPGLPDCIGFNIVSAGSYTVTATPQGATTGLWVLFVDYA
ncbi:MAG: hypothetical protein ACYDCK_01105 [Thermoplasmatota archaeon]